MWGKKQPKPKQQRDEDSSIADAVAAAVEGGAALPVAAARSSQAPRDGGGRQRPVELPAAAAAVAAPHSSHAPRDGGGRQQPVELVTETAAAGASTAAADDSADAPWTVCSEPQAASETARTSRRPLAHGRWRHRSGWRAFFDSHPYHVSVIALVCLDLATVVIDLGITLAHCPEPHLPRSTHELLEALTWISISILGIFVVESLVQFLVFGPLAWCRSAAHMVDFTVIAASFALEVALRSSDLKDVAALLIVFRLWRIVRVLHSTEEILHIEHSQKLSEARTRERELEQELADARGEIARLRGIAAERSGLVGRGGGGGGGGLAAG